MSHWRPIGEILHHDFKVSLPKIEAALAEQ